MARDPTIRSLGLLPHVQKAAAAVDNFDEALDDLKTAVGAEKYKELISAASSAAKDDNKHEEGVQVLRSVMGFSPESRDSFLQSLTSESLTAALSGMRRTSTKAVQQNVRSAITLELHQRLAGMMNGLNLPSDFSNDIAEVVQRKLMTISANLENYRTLQEKSLGLIPRDTTVGPPGLHSNWRLNKNDLKRVTDFLSLAVPVYLNRFYGQLAQAASVRVEATCGLLSSMVADDDSCCLSLITHREKKRCRTSRLLDRQRMLSLSRATSLQAEIERLPPKRAGPGRPKRSKPGRDDDNDSILQWRGDNSIESSSSCGGSSRKGGTLQKIPTLTREEVIANVKEAVSKEKEDVTVRRNQARLTCEIILDDCRTVTKALPYYQAVQHETCEESICMPEELRLRTLRTLELLMHYYHEQSFAERKAASEKEPSPQPHVPQTRMPFPPTYQTPPVPGSDAQMQHMTPQQKQFIQQQAAQQQFEQQKLAHQQYMQQMQMNPHMAQQVNIRVAQPQHPSQHRIRMSPPNL